MVPLFSLCTPSDSGGSVTTRLTPASASFGATERSAVGTSSDECASGNLLAQPTVEASTMRVMLIKSERIKRMEFMGGYRRDRSRDRKGRRDVRYLTRGLR